MALRISRRLWTRGRPLCSGVGRCPSRYAHSASERSVRYGFLMCLMHARVATQIPDYPFSDSFRRNFSEVRALASRNSLYQILAINVALGMGQRAKMWLSPTPIGIGVGLCGGDCYRELRRISLPRTRVNRPVVGNSAQGNAKFYSLACGGGVCSCSTTG